MNIKHLFVAASMAAGVSLGLAAPTHATAVVPGSGWQYDQVDAVGGTSGASPLTFTIDPGLNWGFALTDGFIVGDTYTVVLNGVDTFVSTPGLTATPFHNNFGPYAVPFAADWLNSAYSKLEFFSGPGSFSIVVTGDGVGGIPAGFGYRVDTYRAVPEPATWAMMLIGFAGLGAALRGSRRGSVPAATA